jgi:hypothetical protein
MKTKTLTYNIERHNFSKLAEDCDFAAFLETGRMLNALGTAAESVREIYEQRDNGYRCAEAASFLSRLSGQMLNLVQWLAEPYENEPAFAYFKEMFSGGLREFPGLTVNRIRPAEFRLISNDAGVSKAIRQLDVFGLDILFPRDRETQMWAFGEEAHTQYEFGRYSAIRPKEHIELQHLVRQFTVIHDFSIGAEQFIKAMAKHLGLAKSRKSDVKEEVVTAFGKHR